MSNSCLGLSFKLSQLLQVRMKLLEKKSQKEMPKPCANHEDISGVESLAAMIFTLVTNEAIKYLISFTPRQGRNIGSLRGAEGGSESFGEE